jgi:hypothetical protein
MGDSFEKRARVHRCKGAEVNQRKDGCGVGNVPLYNLWRVESRE